MIVETGEHPHTGQTITLHESARGYLVARNVACPWIVCVVPADHKETIMPKPAHPIPRPIFLL